MAERGAVLVTVGSRVRRLIEAGREATVIAVFQRSLYLRDDEGRIACLGGMGLGTGPLNGLCADWPESAVAPGTRAAWRARTLSVGDLVIEAGAATDWRGARPAGPVDPADVKQGLQRLAALPARGLGRMIPTLIGDASVEPADRFEAAAFAGIAILAGWLRQANDEPPPALEKLIGLGPGLTPAGDDALGGALIALRLFGQAELADRLATWLLPRARGATSDISFAHLEAASGGEGASALHDTLAALAGDDASLSGCVARLDRIGHSSGWDALAGAVAALSRAPRPG